MIQARGGDGLASHRRNKMEEMSCGVSENHLSGPKIGNKMQRERVSVPFYILYLVTIYSNMKFQDPLKHSKTPRDCSSAEHNN